MTMVHRLIFGVLCSVFIFATTAHSFEPITLGVPHFKPYTYTENNQVTGLAANKIRNIFKGIPAELTLKQYLNYSLLLKALKRGDIDGFFLASENSERNRYADFSKPIEYNNWTWFTLRESSNTPNHHDFKYHSIIGTIGKTNTFRWLSRNSYQVQSYNANELLAALQNKQINAAFLAEKVFEYTYMQAGIAPSTFKKHIEIKRPFGIYIAKKYLQKNHNFMSQLNAAIPNIE